MADDARISTAFPRHPKTVKLKRRLGAEGCWSLLCLILWVVDNHPDGDLRAMAAEDIEIAADWDSKPGLLVSTLVEVRFLDGEEGSYRIHDWAEHQPWVVGRPARQAASRIANDARWHGKRIASDSDAPRMRVARGADGTGVPTSPPLPLPPRTIKSKAPVRTFIHPTLEEVRDYCHECGSHVDPQQWFNYYESNGWKVGKNPMKEWRASVRYWEKNGVNHANVNGTRSKSAQRAQHNKQAIIDAFTKTIGRTDLPHRAQLQARSAGGTTR